MHQPRTLSAKLGTAEREDCYDFAEYPDTGQPIYEEEALDYAPLPQIVIVVDELPRNTMGKVQKNLLRDQHKNLFLA